MKTKRNAKRGQTMVEYIIIVALIAITLIAVFTKFGGAIGKKVAGATSALDEELGDQAKADVESIDTSSTPTSLKDLGND